MTATFIATAVLLAGLYALTTIRYIKADRSAYEFSTGPSKGFLIFAHVVYLGGTLAIALEIPFAYLRYDKTDLLCAYAAFLLFVVLGFLMLYTLYFTFEAVQGDEVYVRRLFRRKRYKICDIRRIKNVGKLGIGFFDKSDGLLFNIDPHTKGVGNLIQLINERKPIDDSEETNEAVEASRELILKIGREYRESYEQRRKKALLTTMPICFAIFLGIDLLMYFMDGLWALLRVLLPSVGCMIIAPWSTLTTLKNELKNDDFWLGNQHKYANKRIKGASKAKFKTMRIFCIFLMLCAGVMTAITLPLGIGEKPQSYDAWTPVTGEMEYWREMGGENRYLAVGLYDNPTEYRLSSIDVDELDESFFAEVRKGDAVTLYIDGGDKDRSFSMRGVDRKQWNYCYILEVNGKAYFTYADYLKSYKKNRNVWRGTVVVSTTLAVGTAGTLIGAYFVCKARAENEDIEITL